MPQVYKRSNPTPQQNASPPRQFSGQDTLGAIIAIFMMICGSGGLYNLISSVFTHQDVIGRDKFGNQIVTSPWSLMWWIGMTLCAVAVLYPGYLLIQLLRKQD